MSDIKDLKFGTRDRLFEIGLMGLNKRIDLIFNVISDDRGELISIEFKVFVQKRIHKVIVRFNKLIYDQNDENNKG